MKLIERIRNFDARWIVIFNHTSLLIFGLAAACVQRRPEQIVFAFVVAYLAELLISKVRGDSWAVTKDHFKSATVIVLGLLIFLLSRHWWFYGAAALLAIASKTLILRPSGQHAYNPTGFAILSMVAVFPHHVFVRGDQYNGYLLPYLVVLALGVLTTYLVDRWRQTVCYVIGSLLTSLIVSAFDPQRELLRLFGPDFGVEGLLFMLFMFTDPKTSPRSHRLQVLSGLVIGVLNVSFRTLEFAYSQFLAIFIVASFVAPWFDVVEKGIASLSMKSETPKGGLLPRPLTGLLLILVAAIPILAYLLKVESWPLTDYRMFTERKTIQQSTALLIRVDDNRIQLSRSYLGLHFLVESLIRSKRVETAMQVVRYLYKSHVSAGGKPGNVLIVERLRLNPEGNVVVTESLLKFKVRESYDQ
ncbi:MAG: RnfABCDGE type electron transport complex subunit D [Bdellovibrionales bacterium]|nr:RnfABCDGE type electron transport complex subunit D [Bdellovibrionales bacterium]